MRTTALAFAALAGLSVGACSNSDTTDAKVTEAAAEAQAPQTAAEVATALTKQGIAVQNVVVLDEKTDSNNLLGRPSQYTSKAFFHDARHPKTPDSGDEFEATIEVFASPADAQKRHDYIDQVTSGVPMFVQYQFLRGNVLLRLPKAFTPSETAAYKTAMEKIITA